MIVDTLIADCCFDTLAVLKKRIADFEPQIELAASTDFPPGE